MDRLKERLAIAATAHGTFHRALEADLSQANARDVAILRFAYTFEAVVKTAQLFLANAEGLDLAGPKSIVRASFRAGLLDEGQADRALRMVNDRNLVVHTYNEKLAVELASRLHGHAAVLRAWLDRMQERV
jgi:nucleotidyltransferase substrate binding protein (TIGR01987 family)